MFGLGRPDYNSKADRWLQVIRAKKGPSGERATGFSNSSATRQPSWGGQPRHQPNPDFEGGLGMVGAQPLQMLHSCALEAPGTGNRAFPAVFCREGR